MTSASSPKLELTGAAVLFTIVALLGIGIAAVVGVSVVGNGDSTPLVTSIVGLIVPTVGVLLTLLKVEQVHKVVNSAAAALAVRNDEQLQKKDDQIAAQQDTIDNKENSQ